MRTIRYRDVLWGCAYRIGLDPAKDFLLDQAEALAAYINGWIRRIYDSQDWPEWTVTRELAPNSSHVVPYHVDLGLIIGQPRSEIIGRVFDVYLLDPDTTVEPFAIDFRLNPDGIFVGFEHGTTVWVRYIPDCPEFSSTPWRSDVTYGRGNVVYHPRMGECYRSRVANNRGHDPSVLISPVPSPLPVPPNVGPPPVPVPAAVSQEKEAAQPGVLASEQHTVIGLTGVSPGPDPNPIPAVNDAFFIEVKDADGNLLGDATELGNGTNSLATILTDMANDLAIMAGFTVTANTTDFTIELAAAMDFRISWAFYQPFNGTKNKLPITKTQSYTPAVAGVAGVPQMVDVTFGSDQLYTGATYQVVVTGPDGVQHFVEYDALATDTLSQVAEGLVTGMQASPDAFFSTVGASIDTATNAITLTTDDVVGVDVNISIPASQWWELVPFPKVLADPVIRGEVADVFREEGQTDRAESEEQKVLTEIQAASSEFTAPNFNPLTDQQKPQTRWSIK